MYYIQMTIVLSALGYQLPSFQKRQPYFFLPSPTPLGNSPYILVFHESPPLKIRFFCESPQYSNFSSLNPSYFWK